MQNNSIKFRMPLYISIFALSCVIITGLIFQVFFRYTFESNIQNKNLIISQMISNELELYLKNATNTVVTAANFSTQSKGNLSKIEEEIFRMYDNFDYFDLIFFMNNDAKMVFSKPPNDFVQGRSYTDRDYYWDIIDSEKPSTLSSLLVSSVLNEPHFIIAAPVESGQDHVMGLIGAGIPLENIEMVIGDIMKDFDGKIWLSDQYGHLITHPDFLITDSLISIEDIGISQISTKETFNDILYQTKDETLRYRIGKDSYYGAVSFVKDAGWLVMVEQNKHVVDSQINASMKRLIIFELIVLVIAILVGFLIARWITHPIEGLVRQVRRLPANIVEGQELNRPKLNNPSDEIAELSEAFYDMGFKLKKNIAELETALASENRVQQYLNDILGSVYSGIVVADACNNITMFNQQARLLTGYDEKATVPENIFDLLESLSISKEPILDFLSAGDELISNVEVSMINRDKKEFIIEYSCSSIKNQGGDSLGFIFQFRDITRLKKIEEELRREDRIHTLGELSASIIHDIGNPLAGLSNLIEVLQDEEIDEASKSQVLEILNEEVNDLNVLVINFLDFVKRDSTDKIDVNLNLMLRSVRQLFQKDMINKNIKWHEDVIAEQAIVFVNGRSIKQALINIVKNAIEAIGEGGDIFVELQEGKNSVVLDIYDNGEGMDSETLSKLFHPFFTTKSDGTGLGLFTTYTALKENNVKVEVSSEINAGTKFRMKFEKEKTYEGSGRR